MKIHLKINRLAFAAVIPRQHIFCCRLFNRPCAGNELDAVSTCLEIDFPVAYLVIGVASTSCPRFQFIEHSEGLMARPLTPAIYIREHVGGHPSLSFPYYVTVKIFFLFPCVSRDFSNRLTP